MLDPQFIRNNAALVKKNMLERNMDGAIVDLWLIADKKRKEIRTAVDGMRRDRKGGSKDLSQEEKERIKKIKIELAAQEDALKKDEEEWESLLQQIPNMHPGDVPVGKTGADNKVIFRTTSISQLSFPPKDHIDIAVPRRLIDFERGAKVAGSQFYFLQGDMVLLEMAIIQFIFDLAVQKGYLPLHTPDVARSRYYLGTGYNPRGDEAQTYEIKDEDLGLIATAEVTTAGYHADEVFSIDEFPKKYISISHCFRKEAGAYGKYSRGLYRTHQFTKLELFIYCHPSGSEVFHQEILGIEKEIMEKLKIPYQVLNICTGDLGAMAAKKYDVEAWMPGRNEFGEVTSTSNCTDYQARNLNIRYREKDGTMQYVHMLNGTAGALSRLLIAIIENYQQEDGSIKIPEALRKYMIGGKAAI